MSTGHNVLDMLNQQSKAGVQATPAGRFRTKDIAIASMYPNERNFYHVDHVEELAGEILMCGLLENLVVTYDPDGTGAEYRIVDGERRWEALRLLVERGHEEFALATCRIMPQKSDEEERIDLMAANAQREKTVADLLEEERQLKATLESMKAKGMKLNGISLQEGRLRDVIAAKLKTSTTRIAQMEAINNNLIPELCEKVKAGAITFSAAYELAGMSEEEQRDMLERMESGEDITHKAVKEAKEQRAAEEYKGTLPGMIEAQEAAEAEREQEEQNMDTPNNPFAEECPETGNACNNWERMKRAYLHNGTIQNCAGCCAFCTKAETCPIVCDTVKFSQPQPQQVDAHPDHVTALCYSCAKWSDCMDKAATVTSCDQYAKANTKPQATPEPVKTYTEEETESAPAGPIMTREPRTDEQLLGILRSAGLKSLISSAYVTQQEKNRLESLIASMWARWKQTGGWNNGEN